jgi:hypothetical protein
LTQIPNLDKPKGAWVNGKDEAASLLTVSNLFRRFALFPKTCSSSLDGISSLCLADELA